MVRHRSWWTSSWIHVTVSGVVQLLGLPVCSSSSTDVQLVLNGVCHWNTRSRLKLWFPEAFWIIVRFSIALFPRLAQNLMYTRWSFLWSTVKITTGHIHDSKQTHVKTAHAHPATCNLAHWLTRHGSRTIYQCFTLTQLLYRWRHQSGKFWIPPHMLHVCVCVGRINCCIWMHNSTLYCSSVVHSLVFSLAYGIWVCVVLSLLFEIKWLWFQRSG